jgi:hypothetical protein
MMGIFRGTFALKSRFADVIAQIIRHAIKSDAQFVRLKGSSVRKKGF